MATIVTGCPRSGTSMMMDQCRLAFGEDRILGEKFPQERRLKMQMEQGEEEADGHFKLRQYLQEKFKDPKQEAEFKSAVDMNPNGFWECRYSVQGMAWHFGIEDQSDKVIKIVSQGLVQTDPQYVDKLIFMIRHPRQVAKSQERLRRMSMLPVTAEEEANLKVHTPHMFVNVTYQAAMWMMEYGKDIPTLYINFDDLVAEPDRLLTCVQSFLGEGDFSKHTVTPKLKRSDPEEIEHHLWEVAEAVYAALCEQDWESIKTIVESNRKLIAREQMTLLCTRRMKQSPIAECHHCMTCPTTRGNFKKEAERVGIEWEKEPCMFECGITEGDRPEAIFPTIEESIKNNHWKEGHNAYRRTVEPVSEGA